MADGDSDLITRRQIPDPTQQKNSQQPQSGVYIRWSLKTRIPVDARYRLGNNAVHNGGFCRAEVGGLGMGVMRFVVPQSESLRDWPEVFRVYSSGLDRSVWPTRVEFDGQTIVCRRQNSESSRLHAAWPVEGFGRPVLSTAMLPERDAPYVLAVELARGKIVQVRNQQAAWEGMQLTLPEEYHHHYKQAHLAFGRATSQQQDVDCATETAQEAIIHACHAAELLARAYSQHYLVTRHQQYRRLPTSIGCRLDPELPDGQLRELFCSAFNSATVPIEWKNVEPAEGKQDWAAFDEAVAWCLENRLVVRGGPLIDLSPHGMPQWLWEWEQDFWNLQSFVCDFVETVVARYQGKIRIWELAACANSGGALVLTEEQRLTLVAKTLEVARHVDEEAQFLIRIDQPWGEYQARGQHRLSPIHFADALVRAGLGLSAIDLEIAVGYRPRGTPSRDMLDFSEMIDRWCSLGLPLQVTLAFPSQSGPDPHARSDLEVDRDAWKLPWSPEGQAQWFDMLLPMLVAKPAIAAVHWRQLSDAVPHTFPHSGVVAADGTPKPTLQHMIDYRRKHLK